MKPSLLILIIVVMCAGGLFLLAKSTFSSWPASIATSTPIVTLYSRYPARAVPADSKEFRSDLYDFSVLYPSDLAVTAKDEGSNAATITFENDTTIEGFQIFIVPFSGDQITDARFKQDVPSGVRKDLQNINVDGALGASFYSSDSSMGDTAEIWFIHGGYLYEITSFKDRAQWLSDIISTWKFL